jgi:regulatory protein
VKAAVVRLLARREHGLTELCDKLQQKGFDNAAVEDACRYMELHDLQSDARYADMVVRSKASRGYGEQFIIQYLRQKSIAHSVIQAALQQADIDWLTVIGQLMQKRATRDFDRAKAIHWLLRRGFPYATIEQYYRQD